MSFRDKNKNYIFHPKIIKDLKDNGLLDNYKTKKFNIHIKIYFYYDSYSCTRSFSEYEIIHNLPLSDNEIVEEVYSEDPFGDITGDITLSDILSSLDYDGECTNGSEFQEWKFNFTSIVIKDED